MKNYAKRNWIRIFIISLLSGTFLILHAQVTAYVIVLAQQPADAKFVGVQIAIEKHFNQFNTQPEKNKNRYKQWKRREWFSNAHLEPDIRVSNWTEKQQLAFASLESLPNLNDANGNWGTVEPGSISNGKIFWVEPNRLLFTQLIPISFR